MGPVPSNFEEIGDQVYLVPSNFWDWLLVFTKYSGELLVLPQTS